MGAVTIPDSCLYRVSVDVPTHIEHHLYPAEKSGTLWPRGLRAPRARFNSFPQAHSRLEEALSLACPRTGRLPECPGSH